jgi:hypothetical protein
MIAADLGQALCLATIPVAAIGGWLSIAQLIVVAFLTSSEGRELLRMDPDDIEIMKAEAAKFLDTD